VTGFNVRPPTIHRAAVDLGTVADRFAREVQELQGRLEGYGAPFGNDMIGTLIAETYVAVMEFAMEQFGVVLEDLGYYAEGLSVMADNYDTVESGATGDFDSIRDEL
jgi:hypothetical protein